MVCVCVCGGGGGLEARSISAVCLTCRLHFWVSDSALCQQCSRSLNCDFPLTRLSKYMLPFGLADVFFSSSLFFTPVCGRGDLAELVFFSQHHLHSFSLSYTPESCPAKKSVRCGGSVRRTGDYTARFTRALQKAAAHWSLCLEKEFHRCH